jgi:hypothetical protein
MQVLEEDEERLPDQLELPSRESPIYLPKARQNKTLHFHQEDSSVGRQGRSWVSKERGSRSDSAPLPNRTDPVMPQHLGCNSPLPLSTKRQFPKI